MNDHAGRQPDRIVTWDEVHRDAKELVRRLLPLGPWKGIVAVTRGGLVPAAILARELEIRYVDTLCIASYDEKEMGATEIIKTPAEAVADKGAGWLLIDDLVDTGATMRAARELVPDSHVATLYAKPGGLQHVNTHIHDSPQDVWIFFPWDTSPQYVAPMARGSAVSAAPDGEEDETYDP